MIYSQKVLLTGGGVPYIYMGIPHHHPTPKSPYLPIPLPNGGYGQVNR